MVTFLYSIGIFGSLLIIYGYCSNYACKVTRQTILLEKSNADFNSMKFVIVSDLHGHSFGKRNQILLKKIREAHPDAILIPGDMIVKNGRGKEVCFLLLEELRRDYPIYYSPGNHESSLNDEADFREKVQRLGIYYLENDNIILQKNKQSIQIFGLSLSHEYYYKIWNRSSKLNYDDEVSKMMGDCLGLPEQKNINLLLAHNPEYFKAYEQWGADVVISGHVHGGIMTLWFGGVIAPSLRLFPKYSNGNYKRKQTHMYVSRGLGLHHIKLRFFNLPELAVVTILGGEK